MIGGHSFNDAVFGRSQSNSPLDPAQERQRLAALLATKVTRIDELFSLTDAQKRKLELAGRGDLHRLFEKIEDLRPRCQAVIERSRDQNDVTFLLEWARGVSREIQPLKVTLPSGPFGEGSLFAKTMAGMLSPEQVAEYRRQQSAVARQPAQAALGVRPAAPLTAAEHDARLGKILAEWEKASSRIERLDCQFTRFKYDRTFEVEWRGLGSLAIEKSGRAMYRLAAEPIKQGDVSKKLAPTGVPYALKSEEPERWHWTGDRVIRVNQKDRTYEELIRKGAIRSIEFEPEPPALPDDVAQHEKARQAKSLSASRKERGSDQSATIGELLLNLVFGTISIKESPPLNWFEAFSQFFFVPSPFLVDMTVRELNGRYHVLLKQETDTEVWLELTPKLKKELANMSKATLILFKDRYLPKAVKTVDPTGAETVHVFKNVQINARGLVEDLEHPNLQGYRRVLNEIATER